MDITTSNAEQLSALVSELFGGTFNKEFTVDDVKRILAQNNIWLFTHKEDDVIVGMAVLYVIELFSRKVGVIEEVVTLKDYRRRGIASELLQVAIDQARALNVTCLELNVREDALKVQELYKKFGFYDRNNKAMRLWINKQ
jgi:ribosomal protein S18 acetylase RimI-like enzyme